MLTRRMLGALCWAVAVGGCGAPELPPVVASAPGITIRSSVPMDECTASLSIGYYRTLSDLLGVDQAIEVVRVDDLDAWCRDGVDGCEYGSRAYTVLDFHPHEITHAVFASAGRSLPFLEEGVAELGECALGMPAYVTPTSLPLTESLVFRDSFSGVVGDERTTATQFVSYAVRSSAGGASWRCTTACLSSRATIRTPSGSRRRWGDLGVRCSRTSKQWGG
jgi:hypothetical protein